MATANVVTLLLLTVWLSNRGGVSSKDCSYQFTQQPESELKCTPFGTQLQLHCGVTGPRLPTFTLEWYVSSTHIINSIKDSLKLSALPEYKVQTVAFDFMGGMRSRSSILLTKMITSEDAGICFYCRIEFLNGLKLSHTSNTLCIEREEYYKEFYGATPCSNGGTIIVDTSVQCANISNKLALDLNWLKRVKTLKPSHGISTTTDDPKQIHTPAEQLSLVENLKVIPTTLDASITVVMVIPTATHTDRNTSHKGSQSFSTFFSDVLSIHRTKTQAMTTPSPSMSVSLLDLQFTSIAQNSTNSSMEEDTVSRSTFEVAVYSVVLVIIVFAVVIAIFILVVCCLKSKRSCLKGVRLTRLGEMALRPRTRIRSTAEGNKCRDQQLGVCVVNRGSDRDSQETSRAASLQINSPDEPLHGRDIADGSNNRKLFECFSEKYFSKWRLPLIRQMSNIENHAHPHLPRPRRADTLPSRHYDHLELKTTGSAQKRIDADCSSHNKSAEGSPNTGWEFTRSKHSRSQSADSHYYYTLERREERSSTVQSVTVSPGSGQANGVSHQHVQSYSDKASTRCLRDLFDEPQYISMVVNNQDAVEEEEPTKWLTNRRHLSRSSPSVVMMLPPAAGRQHVRSERRLICLPQWLKSTPKTAEACNN